jgi:DNA polymerase-3 subunit delta'
MLLLTERPQSVLPTIVSRCQVLRFGYLTPEQIAEGLTRHGAADLGQEARDQAVSFAMGSLARALDLAAHPVAEAGAPALEFWRLCRSGDRLALAARIDELAAARDFDACVRVFQHIGHAARDGCVKRAAGPEKYIPNDGLEAEVGSAAPDVSAAVLDLCRHSISALHAHGNAALVLVNFANGAAEIFNE